MAREGRQPHVGRVCDLARGYQICILNTKYLILDTKMQQPSELIKEKIDIVDFLKGYIDLKPAGRNFKARCPFHQEKTPSFMVSRERQTWHCFGSCQKGGDIFKFLMEYENIEFYEALKILAEKAGIELKTLTPNEHRQFGVLYEICDATKDFYVENFKKFPVAHKYLSGRGLKDETIKEFEIGFAPNDFDPTTRHLLGLGFKIDDIVRAGISFRTEAGRYGDRFRGRIMFPIHDHFGKVVGFTGRILPELDNGESGKYVNSPETPIFNKSKVLYGFWTTKRNIRDAKTALLVEGQMDFLMTYQTGIKNVIATSGTALTPEHLKVLKPIAEKIVMAFDNDEAGLNAIERAIDLIGSNDFNVAVFNLGDYKDPADAAAADPEFLKRQLEEARSALDHYMDRYLSAKASATEGLTPQMTRETKKINVRKILERINKLWSKLDQSEWIRELSARSSIAENDLREELIKLGGGEKFSAQVGVEPKTKADRLDILSMRILSLLALRNDLLASAAMHADMMPPDHRAAYHLLSKTDGVSAEDKSAGNRRIRELVDFISLRSGLEIGDEASQDEEFDRLLKELEIEYLKKKQDEVRLKLIKAENSGNETEHAELAREFDNVSRKIQDIKKKIT